jgi:hypothetical protein
MVFYTKSLDQIQTKAQNQQRTNPSHLNETVRILVTYAAVAVWGQQDCGKKKEHIECLALLVDIDKKMRLKLIPQL